MKETCNCSSEPSSNLKSDRLYICYCNHVSDEDIKQAILNGASSVQEVIKKTGAMQNSNCAVNNPKGTCYYQDIVATCDKYL